MNYITKLTHKLMLVAAAIVVFAGVPQVSVDFVNTETPSVQIDLTGQVYARGEGGTIPLYTNVNCSGDAATWIGTSLAVSIACFAAAVQVWKWAKKVV
ncbi:MAG: hypothetical protein OXH84_07500 [Gammaproteobacteria bacterium]|nr:hypothetical protein [Gammaproteobacteria bacterium]